MSVAGRDYIERPSDPETAAAEPQRLSPVAAVAAFLAVGAPTVYLSFNGGGFFVTAPALVAIALLLGLLVRVMVADRPFGGIGRIAGVAIAGMALFSVWTLVSALWSDAPARALIEFDRALLYLAALTLFASIPARPGLLRTFALGFLAAIAVIGVIALITRVLPEVWPLAANKNPDRLSYPLTYWNALGLLAGLGIVAALHFSAHEREPLGLRVASAGLIPLLTAVLYFTLSRGSIAIALAGAALYLLVARPRGTLTVLAAVALPVAAVVLAGYDADALSAEDPTTALAVEQGHRVALVIVVATLVAAGLRLATAPLERRLPSLAGRRLPVSPWLLGAGAVVLVAVGLIASGAAGRVIDEFRDTDAVAEIEDQRERLLSASNNGRSAHWSVAIDAFARHPLRGTGAGTYQTEWAQHRDIDFTVIHAHSLYAQVLGELGIVGLLLLLVPLVALLGALAHRARGPNRALPAMLLALGLMWAVHAGIDWDWEMPAITLWLFALGGAALAVPPSGRAWAHRSTPRLLLGLCCLLVAVTPGVLALSQMRLDRAADALGKGDCVGTIRHSLSSISVLGVRPQPYALVGLCDMHLGETRLAVRMMRSAVARDPADWEWRYLLALALAADGQDPMADARRARELNPLDPRARHLVQAFRGATPQERAEYALQAQPPW